MRANKVGILTTVHLSILTFYIAVSEQEYSSQQYSYTFSQSYSETSHRELKDDVNPTNPELNLFGLNLTIFGYDSFSNESQECSGPYTSSSPPIYINVVVCCYSAFYTVCISWWFANLIWRLRERVNKVHRWRVLFDFRTSFQH